MRALEFQLTVPDKTRGGNVKHIPEILQHRHLSRALFGTLKEQIGFTSPDQRTNTDKGVREEPPSYGTPGGETPLDRILADAALKMEEIIKEHAVVRWRENADAQNRMRNHLDDFLFELQKEKGIALSFPQMDAIIESAIRIAIHRTDDV